MVAYPIYLKYLGVELYGLWAAVSVVVFFSRLGELGINDALIKYVAAEFGKGDYQRITEYATTSICILIIPSILIISTLFIFVSEIVTLLALKPAYVSQAEKLIPLIGLLSVFIFFTELVKGVLMGIGRVDISNYVFLSGQIIRVVMSIVLVISGFGIWSLYWGTVFSSASIFLVYVFILCFLYKIKILSVKSFTKNCVGELLAFGGTMFSARVVSMLIEPFNKVIISRYIGLSEVAYYEIALRSVGNLRSFYERGLKAIMPKVSELQQKSQNFRKAVRNIHDKSIKFILIFALPVFLGLFILSKAVLSIWLGDRYNVQISTALRWYLFGYIINLFSVPAYYILVGLNKVKYCLYTAMLRSFGHSAIILLFIITWTSIKFNFIVMINVFAMMASASFIITAYYFKVGKRTVDLFSFKDIR